MIGGAGNDLLIGGIGKDTYDLSKGGNDSISVASGVTEISVGSFTAGDEIQFATAPASLSTDANGNLVADLGNNNSVTIGGLTNSSTGNGWQLINSVASYVPTTIAGATLSGNKIVYTGDSVSANASLVLNGIASTIGLAVDDSSSIVSIGKDNFADDGVTVSANSGNYMFNLTADNYSGNTFTGMSTADIITVASGATNLVVNALAGNDSIINAGASVTVSGGDDADSISNTGDNSSIDGGNGNDIINNSGSNVSISGGAGNDLFVLGGGNATITDYNANSDSDTIQLASGMNFSVDATGKVSFYTDDYSVFVDNSKDKFIATTNGTSSTVAAYYDNASVNNDATTTLILGAGFSGTVEASNYTPANTQVTAIDATAAINSAITFAGFSSIDGFSAGKHTLSGTPIDAAISGKDLVVSLSGTTPVTLGGISTQTISVGDYKVAAGMLNLSGSVTLERVGKL